MGRIDEALARLMEEAAPASMAPPEQGMLREPRPGPLSNWLKGRRFEHLVKEAFEAHPHEWGKERFEEVLLWDDWPDRWGRDNGIDLVARQTAERGGELVAIQCKYRPNGQIRTDEIAGFLPESGTGDFGERLRPGDPRATKAARMSSRPAARVGPRPAGLCGFFDRASSVTEAGARLATMWSLPGGSGTRRFGDFNGRHRRRPRLPAAPA